VDARDRRQRRGREVTMLSRRRMLWLGSGLAAGLTLPARPAQSHNGGHRVQSPRLRKFVDPLPRLRPQLPPEAKRDGPYLHVERRPYRFRILNASNGRFYRLRLSDGQPFVQIGTDQGLMAAPVELDTLLLVPAERADVIVDFGRARAGTIRLTNDAAAPYPGGEHPERDTVGEVMEFRVARRAPRSRPAAIPGRLGTLTPLPQSGAIVRYTALREYQNSRGEPIIILIDSRRWDGPVTIRPRLGDTEIWHFINTTDDSHPIHLHLVRFQVLDHQPFDVKAYLAWGAEKPGEGPDPIPVEPYLQGERKPPSAQDRGWKDTVQVDPHEVVRIIARFDGYTGRYPWHCHMLEHEDNEMMLQFEVVAPAGT
jgi:spore coat protein A, manganese oxidase